MICIKKALNILGLGLFLILFACSKNVSDKINSEKTLLRGNGAEPETLDPQLVRSESAGNIVRDLYEGLLTEAADGSLIAGVADAWSYDPASLCYQFNLRQNAKWSNGDTVSSSDFKRGLEFALTPDSMASNAELLKSITRIDSTKPHTLVICLAYSIAYFPEILALPVSFPRHLNAANKQHLYNGAYTLQNWIPQDKIILAKNAHFHSRQSVYFDQVQYLSTENSSSELKRYLAGELDISVTIPPNDIKRLRNSHADAIKIAPVLNSYFYGFNSSKAPFKNNLKLRKALSLAVDRDILVERILGTGEKAAFTLVPPGISNYQSPKLDYQQWSQIQRNSHAKQLYLEAGYTVKNPLKFELRYNTSPVHKKIAVALASMWKETLGVKVSLYNEEWKVFVDNRRKKNTQMFRSGWIADVNDASNYLELLSSSHPLNDYAYNNSQFDQLLDNAKTAESKRISILQAAERQMLEDHAIIPLYYYVSKHLVRPDIRGWQDNSLDHHLSRYLSRKASKH